MHHPVGAKVATKRFADLIFWSVIAITVANYSFLTFDYSGELSESNPLKPLAYARLPLVIIGYLYLLVVDTREQVSRRYKPAIVLLIASIVLSIPFSTYMQTAFLYGIWFVFTVLFLSRYVAHVVQAKGVESAMYHLFLPLMFMGLYYLLITLAALPQYNIGRPFPAIYSTRVQVSMIIPLYLGGLAICLSLFRRQQIVKLGLLSFAVFCLVVIAASGKRASILCALIIMAAYFVYQMKVSGKLVVVMLAPLTLFILLFAGFQETAEQATEYSRIRIEKGFDERTSTSIQGRFKIWDRAGDLLVTRPLGVGLNVGREVVDGGLHNTYLGFLLETGWISFLIVMALVFYTGYRGYFSGVVPVRKVFLYMTVPTFLYSFTEYNTAPGQPLFVPFWVCIFYTLYASRKRRFSRVDAFVARPEGGQAQKKIRVS